MIRYDRCFPTPESREAGNSIAHIVVDAAVLWGDLHPARKYQPSTGPVKGSKIL